MHVTGVGHVMRHDAGCVCDEMSGVGLGLSGRRDRFGTKPGMSHNSIPPSRPHLEAWEGWSMPIPQHLVREIKGSTEEGLIRIVTCLAQRCKFN